MLNNKINEVDNMKLKYDYVIIKETSLDALDYGLHKGDLMKKKLFDLVVKQLKKEGLTIPTYTNRIDQVEKVNVAKEIKLTSKQTRK